ncbi:N-acetyl-gamma-glutamyl-phosphate reductase [Collinsella ihumii]|uniref:N-acetyl-gamma-glutamyl-phosphate reductase n=1 Tax=Collinsella ihumii TaxID=1720204 RepID=UPI00082AC36B|nr:N-acetyl-gamma-glutamyl-phosphate reductase [Collinsella ihumii]
MAYRVGVVGAAGYAGIELVRLLLGHPQFKLVAITSNADAGQKLVDVYPAFAGVSDLEFTTHDNPLLTACDAVFLAVPHTAALAAAPGLLKAGVSVFDLSADFRLSDPAVYEVWYNTQHTSPELLKTRAFGLPELFAADLARAAASRAAGEAVLVACAGCYPTATSLGAYPAIQAGWMAEGSSVVVDAISGVTGAGKSANARTHYCSADENVEAYGVCKHRHTPEIEQILGLEDRVVFTPHLAPLKRGLLSTVNIPLAPEVADTLTTEDAVARYRAFYEGSPFVRVLDAGQFPKTSSVAGSNACQIGLAVNGRARMLVITSAIDNLCKGAAGQAIQCANIVLGLDETCGLPLCALPV